MTILNLIPDHSIKRNYCLSLKFLCTAVSPPALPCTSLKTGDSIFFSSHYCGKGTQRKTFGLQTIMANFLRYLFHKFLLYPSIFHLDSPRYYLLLYLLVFSLVFSSNWSVKFTKLWEFLLLYTALNNVSALLNKSVHSSHCQDRIHL